MSKKLKRVPLDFSCIPGTDWEGYINPYESEECSKCNGSGYNRQAQHLYDQWYGNAPFHPSETGSTLLQPTDEAVYSFAQRNYPHRSKEVVFQEAQRLAELWNNKWHCHLDQEDVYALVVGNRLYDFTKEFIPGEGWVPKKHGTRAFWCPVGKEPPIPQENSEHTTHICQKHQCEMVLLEPDDILQNIPWAHDVNQWSIRGFGHDSTNAWLCVKAKAARLGFETQCEECGGGGRIWESEEIEQLSDSWEFTEPPTGDGYQLWGDDGPLSRVYDNLDDLCDWCEFNAYTFGYKTATASKWKKMLEEDFVHHSSGNSIFS